MIEVLEFEPYDRKKVYEYFQTLYKRPQTFEEYVSLVKDEINWSYDLLVGRKQILTTVSYLTHIEKDVEFLNGIYRMTKDYLDFYYVKNEAFEIIRKGFEKEGLLNMFERYIEAQNEALGDVEFYLRDHLKIGYHDIDSEVVALYCVIVKENFPDEYILEEVSIRLFVKRYVNTTELIL